VKRQAPSFWFTSKGVAALSLIGAASYFLLTEHRAHALSFLPYLILLACPLMHMFMHGKHGHNRSKASDHSNGDNKEQGRSSDKGDDSGRR
jgi:hypothetical protein